jgi:hypothetical protein
MTKVLTITLHVAHLSYKSHMSFYKFSQNKLTDHIRNRLRCRPKCVAPAVRVLQVTQDAVYKFWRISCNLLQEFNLFSTQGCFRKKGIFKTNTHTHIHTHTHRATHTHTHTTVNHLSRIHTRFHTTPSILYPPSHPFTLLHAFCFCFIMLLNRNHIQVPE